MRVLVAPQEFKGSLSAVQAAKAIARGVRDVLPDASVIEAPISDGGPGLVDVLLAALGGGRASVPCHDPLMRPIRAEFGVLGDGTVVIEMAAASGLVLLSKGELNPLRATTFGTGELIRAALDRGCREIVLGVGGSATVDGGAGAAQALGARFLDRRGHLLPPGGAALQYLDRIDTSAIDTRLQDARIRIASDVRSPLTGDTGAALMFSPQKGASPDDAQILERALAHYADVLARDFGVEITAMPGAGAAGGLGAALVALAGATIEPGFDLVAGATGLDRKIAAAHFSITGEGRLDAQTAQGKSASGVARMTRAHRKPVGVIAGFVDASYTAGSEFDEIEELKPLAMSVDEAMREAPELLRRAAARIAPRLAARSSAN
jgi:glycerate kinase